MCSHEHGLGTNERMKGTTGPAVSPGLINVKKSVRLKMAIETSLYLKHTTLAFCGTRELRSSSRIEKMELL